MLFSSKGQVDSMYTIVLDPVTLGACHYILSTEDVHRVESY
jgi:hypothetical protein